MPYKSEKLKLKRSLDLRVKLTEAHKKEILRLYHEERLPIRGIARVYPQISRRSIQFVLFPERAEKVQERAKELKRWKKYNKKEHHTPTMKKYRRRKQELYKKGLLG